MTKALGGGPERTSPSAGYIGVPTRGEASPGFGDLVGSSGRVQKLT
jgi:hypothetical protein